MFMVCVVALSYLGQRHLILILSEVATCLVEWAGAARTAGVRYCSGVYCVRLLMHDSADPICMVVAVGGEDASAGSIAALGCCLLVCAISTIDCVYVFYGIVLNARRLKAVVA